MRKVVSVVYVQFSSHDEWETEKEFGQAWLDYAAPHRDDGRGAYCSNAALHASTFLGGCCTGALATARCNAVTDPMRTPTYRCRAPQTLSEAEQPAFGDGAGTMRILPLLGTAVRPSVSVQNSRK
ncbi:MULTISPECIES: hypothetical protein [unclassified Caballeronia]|uniref:hypothetical protein n=1 Tax=unclassified Caballeronia TaxID=2646786 RepID=UPI001FD58F38|nr:MULTISPECIES: hypothetical protein [unclassified Caballeronia]MDR5880511.1 hypothetical protein [Caballeronia sp. LZ032]